MSGEGAIDRIYPIKLQSLIPLRGLIDWFQLALD
jgi:hypothetical protein|tara:strand:+ start:70 stop:171 length:102 start_codon:yes stop_codon:yes gene_type:complete